MAFIQMNFKSRCLRRGININVFMPYRENGTEIQTPYKTLYMLPGFSGSGLEMATGLPFRHIAARYGVAVVIPDCENSYYIDKPERYNLYSQYVGQELVDVTRELFPLSHQRVDTYIGGISMGGYGALYNGIHFADTFSKILAMSPGANIYQNKHVKFEDEYMESLFTDEEHYIKGGMDPDTEFVEAKKKGKQIPEIYLCCGRQDPLVYEADLKFVNNMRKNNIPIFYREDEGAHENALWSKYLPEGFAFLTSEKTEFRGAVC